MRNMSFALTTPQFLDGTKTVTRRLGWRFLKPGDRVMAVEKGMGLGKGGKVKRLGVIEILDVRREPLNAITARDVAREGFPERGRNFFVEMFCSHMRCEPTTEVTRIVFRKRDERLLLVECIAKLQLVPGCEDLVAECRQCLGI